MTNGTVIRNFSVEGENFVIWKDSNGYWSFNEKDIDENGRLTKVYNGAQGCLSKDLAETLRMTYIRVRCVKELDNDKFKSLDLGEFEKYNKIWEDAKKLF